MSYTLINKNKIVYSQTENLFINGSNLIFWFMGIVKYNFGMFHIFTGLFLGNLVNLVILSKNR